MIHTDVCHKMTSIDLFGAFNMKYITTLILMFFIVGCVPYMTYYEMEEAHEIAETQEEKDALRKRIDTFEANAEKARLYFDEKQACSQSQDVSWFCKDVHSTEERRIKSLDGLVRAYKREHQSCGCVHTSSMADALHRY